MSEEATGFGGFVQRGRKEGREGGRGDQESPEGPVHDLASRGEGRGRGGRCVTRHAQLRQGLGAREPLPETVTICVAAECQIVVLAVSAVSLVPCRCRGDRGGGPAPAPEQLGAQLAAAHHQSFG